QNAPFDSAACRRWWVMDSERDVVVQIAQAGIIERRCLLLRLLWLRLCLWRRPRLLRRTAERCTAAVAAALTTATAGVEHLHVASHYFGGITILAILALPLARLQAPLDIH